MTIHDPNPAQNIYNAPTQPAYAIQSGNRNRTIPISLGQGQASQASGHASRHRRGTGGTQVGSTQNVGGSGGVVAGSGSGGRSGHGGSGNVRVVGQSVTSGGSQGRNLTNGGGNRGGTSQHTNASVMQAQAQVQYPRIPSNRVNAQPQVQHQQIPVNYVHPQAHHPQAHHPQAYNPHPPNPIHHIQPLVGGVFSPHAPHIPLLSRLGPYVPRTRGPRPPPTNFGGNRSAYGPAMQLPGLPVPFGYPQMGNMNTRGMGMGNGVMNVIDNGWDSRWDGSGGDRGRGVGSRGGRGRRRR